MTSRLVDTPEPEFNSERELAAVQQLKPWHLRSGGRTVHFALS